MRLCGKALLTTALLALAVTPAFAGEKESATLRGAVQSGGYPIFIPTDGKVRGIDALDVFESCVEAAARYVIDRRDQ